MYLKCVAWRLSVRNKATLMCCPWNFPKTVTLVFLLFDIFSQFWFSLNENFFTRGTTAPTHSRRRTRNDGKCSTEQRLCVCVSEWVCVNGNIFTPASDVRCLKNRNENWMNLTIIFCCCRFQLGYVRVNMLLLAAAFMNLSACASGCKADIRHCWARKWVMLPIGGTRF